MLSQRTPPAKRQFRSVPAIDPHQQTFQRLRALELRVNLFRQRGKVRIVVQTMMPS